ncbi:ABC transporter ATP-binding protein [Pseudonocardia sulfidoxydans NBRC 16205]|uniref:ABC transporter ATP-binding protein n=1 Tax=Pseudonocardia sulfidoxydans NBRC 16205 TaxID=1223511 RepID=A0A511DE94_9PSEU|nr:ATP-binding cassette domain-containing protein [Pseudonocardia sulfidoxydans]GEL23096.1 ABC transporter ATP-binding protein [Pseudonocardia sulfidoxydans NBRC 16205]
MTAPGLVEVRDLVLCAGGRTVLDGVRLDVAAGEAVGIVGASGSGKTTTALAVLGHLRDGITHVAGTVHVAGAPVLPGRPPRGVGYLGQDPGASLNPYRTVRAVLTAAGGVRRDRAGVDALLGRVGLPAGLARRYPHQLSGGQQQRVALAIALARDPGLLVLDEPTTGLDVLARADVHRELASLRAAGVALLWIGHDAETLAANVDRLVTVADGRVVASGPPEPARFTLTSEAAPAEVVLAASGIVGGYGATRVLHGVDLHVGAGERVAVLGASGTGKTTLARVLAGLHPAAADTVTVDGATLHPDVRRRTRPQRAALQYVAQSPSEALHPRQPVRTALHRPLRLLRNLRGAAADAEAAALLEVVGLSADTAGLLPAELSGGQRQRVSLARALAARPRVLVCDEVTSALDPGTRDAVLGLLGRLCAQDGLGVVLVTHDVEVAATADRVVVLAEGHVVADGPVPDVLGGDLLPGGVPSHLVELLRPDVADPTVRGTVNVVPSRRAAVTAPTVVSDDSPPTG